MQKYLLLLCLSACVDFEPSEPSASEAMYSSKFCSADFPEIWNAMWALFGQYEEEVQRTQAFVGKLSAQPALIEAPSLASTIVALSTQVGRIRGLISELRHEFRLKEFLEYVKQNDPINFEKFQQRQAQFGFFFGEKVPVVGLNVRGHYTLGDWLSYGTGSHYWKGYGGHTLENFVGFGIQRQTVGFTITGVDEATGAVEFTVHTGTSPARYSDTHLVGHTAFPVDAPLVQIEEAIVDILQQVQAKVENFATQCRNPHQRIPMSEELLKTFVKKEVELFRAKVEGSTQYPWRGRGSVFFVMPNGYPLKVSFHFAHEAAPIECSATFKTTLMDMFPDPKAIEEIQPIPLAALQQP